MKQIFSILISPIQQELLRHGAMTNEEVLFDKDYFILFFNYFRHVLFILLKYFVNMLFRLIFYKYLYVVHLKVQFQFIDFTKFISIIYVSYVRWFLFNGRMRIDDSSLVAVRISLIT